MRTIYLVNNKNKNREIMATIAIIGVALLVGVVCYIIGLRRGIKISEQEHQVELANTVRETYWEGYNDGRLDPDPKTKDEWYNQGFNDGKEYRKTCKINRLKNEKFLESLEYAFGPEEDNVEILDGGEY